ANFKRARYHRENPFIFFEEKDIKGFWQDISEFFGVDSSFPVDQLMTRIASDSGRNIYFVSDSLKEIVTLNQDRIKDTIDEKFNKFDKYIENSISIDDDYLFNK
ncbi:unnamed protein product, partial [Rotaria sordida]